MAFLGHTSLTGDGDRSDRSGLVTLTRSARSQLVLDRPGDHVKS
jgi:hypothetical protein